LSEKFNNNGNSEKSLEEYEKQEKEFKYNQMKKRAIIRVSKNRAVLLDNLLYLTMDDQHISEYDITTFDDFSTIKFDMKSLEELKQEIDFILIMNQHVEYWKLLYWICDQYIQEINDYEESIVPEGVLRDLYKEMQSMNFNQLTELEIDIKRSIESGEALYEEYWCALLPKLNSFKAKAKLNEIQNQFIQVKLLKLPEDQRQQWIDKKNNHVNFNETKKPNRILNNNFKYKEPELTDEELMLLERERPREVDEEEFDGEFPIPLQIDLDYTPIKPLYFNTVKKIFFWNPYNRHHYNEDNPPPKQIQGYKFNIFLTRLENKKESPHFYLEPCVDPDYEILRFRCGKPYSDIAFKIVKRDWQKTRKFGYKSCFANGVLQLWFNFKVFRWRR